MRPDELEQGLHFVEKFLPQSHPALLVEQGRDFGKRADGQNRVHVRKSLTRRRLADAELWLRLSSIVLVLVLRTRF
jgi:hypothetical protein